MLKITERISKFQPKYAESISNLQQEYIQLMKQIVDNVFAVQREWAGSNLTSTNTIFPTLNTHHMQNNLEDNLMKSLHKH